MPLASWFCWDRQGLGKVRPVRSCNDSTVCLWLSDTPVQLDPTVKVLARAMGLHVREWIDAGDKGAGWGGDSFVFNFMRPERNSSDGGPVHFMRGSAFPQPSARVDDDARHATSNLSSVLRATYESRVRSKEGLRVGGMSASFGGTVLR